MGRNLWSYCLEVAKVPKQKKSLRPGCDASEKRKHWGILQDNDHPQRAAEKGTESLPCLTSALPQGWWPSEVRALQHRCPPPVQTVARGTQMKGTRATAN